LLNRTLFTELILELLEEEDEKVEVMPEPRRSDPEPSADDWRSLGVLSALSVEAEPHRGLLSSMSPLGSFRIPLGCRGLVRLAKTGDCPILDSTLLMPAIREGWTVVNNGNPFTVEDDDPVTFCIRVFGDDEERDTATDLLCRQPFTGAPRQTF
jgi:hypothetical protein